MNLSDMRAQPDQSNNLSKANFFDWKEAGTLGAKVRPYGKWIRRYLHFVTVNKANGDSVIAVVPCINFDYTAKVVVPIDNGCPLDEVHEAQLKGETSNILPFVRYNEPPASWGKDAKIQMHNFTANVNVINRAKQEVNAKLNGSGITEECLQVVSFKKTAWDKILLLAGAIDNADPDFTRGDPSDPVEGYDIKLMYHADKPGIQRYQVVEGKTAIPLTDGEIESIQDSIDLEEYYKTRTRDGIIEHLTKIYESDGMHGAGGGFANTSSENVTDGIADMMTKAESAMSTA